MKIMMDVRYYYPMFNDGKLALRMDMMTFENFKRLMNENGVELELIERWVMDQ